MEKTTRRGVLRAAAAGGLAATGFGIFQSARAVAQPHGNHNGNPRDQFAAATISFGEWGISAAGAGLPGPLDRFAPATSSPNNRNVHLLLPGEVEIDAGGSVNFIISGFHLVLVYDDGTEPGDIDTTLITPGSSPPGLIDDPDNRIYRGLDPRTLSYAPLPTTPPTAVTVRDRVEVVRFPVPGRYLAACGVLPHFQQGMFGYINVKGRGVQ